MVSTEEADRRLWLLHRLDAAREHEVVAARRLWRARMNTPEFTAAERALAAALNEWRLAERDLKNALLDKPSTDTIRCEHCGKDVLWDDAVSGRDPDRLYCTPGCAADDDAAFAARMADRAESIYGT